MRKVYERNSMNNRIALLIANEKGGMVQYMYEIFKALRYLDYEPHIFAPQNADLHLSDEERQFFHGYNIVVGNNKIINKIQSWNSHNSNVKSIIMKIEGINPKYLWTTDDKIITTQVGKILSSRVQTIMTIHDPSLHPENDKSILRRINQKAWYYFREKYVEVAGCIAFASSNSMQTYISFNPKVKRKAYYIPIGAQIPIRFENRPNDLDEIIEEHNYFLFFGRIEKYKGIDLIIETYHSSNEKVPLVIAGSGQLTKAEQEIIECEPDRIKVINRFIDDSEMLWLIRNAKAIVLPYIEASQSGVLPIAYYYGVPVITSDSPGLAQFVEEGITGYVCSSADQYKEAYKKVTNNMSLVMCADKIRAYYDCHLDWNTNVREFMNVIDNC